MGWAHSERGAVGVQWGWNSIRMAWSGWRALEENPRSVGVGNWLEVLGLVQRPLPLLTLGSLFLGASVSSSVKWVE